MKIFEFDPITGSRGDFICYSNIASYCSGTFFDKNVKIPKSTVTCTWRLHKDSGIVGKDGKSYSLRHDTKFVCFCLGEWTSGTDKTWEWVIIPPLCYKFKE